jgi:Flp pilus assembly protein TadD
MNLFNFRVSCPSLLGPLSRLTLVLALGIASQMAWAADDPEPKPAGDKLAAARAHIAAGKWAAAIDELKRVGDTRSADWNNLMGYSHRKAKTPDLPAAERYYGEALRIDAGHKGALEYSGELYLMLGKLEVAEQRLASLERVCRATCEEYKDLKSAIGRYKAAGNKYVPQ